MTLHAYECVTIQFVLVCSTPQLLLSVFTRSYFVLFEMCQTILRSVQSSSHNFSPVGQIVWPCTVGQENDNVALENLFWRLVCQWCDNRSLSPVTWAGAYYGIVLQISTNAAEDDSFQFKMTDTK